MRLCVSSLLSRTTPPSAPLQLEFINSHLAGDIIKHVIHASGKSWDYQKQDINAAVWDYSLGFFSERMGEFSPVIVQLAQHGGF